MTAAAHPATGSSTVAAPADAGCLARLRDRLRSFHRGDDGQILPLLFFLGLAFFIGAGLVVNTGRTVNRRIESQNAVDAAAVSGATSVARGMNYLATNNVTMTKVLASIVIIRSFEKAIQDSDKILTAWLVGAEVMLAVGKALVATGLFAALGAAMQTVGGLIKAKVRQERYVLKYLLKIARPIARFWDNEVKPGESPAEFRGAGRGWGWKATRCMSLLGDVIAYGTPVLAQLAAKTIHGENLSRETGADCWMVPLYPRLPVCRGPFSLHGTPAATFIHDEVMIYVDVVGWSLMTLSFFPLTFRAEVGISLKKVFPTAPATSGPDTPDDPDKEELERLANRIEEIRREMEPIQLDLNTLNAGASNSGSIAWAEAQEDARHAEWKALNRKDHGDAAVDAAKQRYDDAKDLRKAREKRRREDEKALKDKEDEIEDLQGQIEDITDKHDDEPGGKGPDGKDGGGFGEVEPLPLPAGVKRGIHPYVVDDGGAWETAATYFTFGYRDPVSTFLPAIYPPPKIPMPSPLLDVLSRKTFAYAAARIYSPNVADLWTADWRAKLIRADMGLIPRNPVGKPPGTCSPPLPEVEAEPEAIDIYGWTWDGIDTGFGDFTLDWNVGLSAGPGSAGKH